jgi:hypothetical protein
MLSEAETKRLRAEVHAALAARQYALARAKLQELAHRSQGTWPASAPEPPLLEAWPRVPWETRAHRRRQVAAGLLLSVIAAGMVLVGVSGLSEDHLRIFAAGAWLLMGGLGVTAILAGWLLLRANPDR